jgi:transcriptional regulator with XRE-family HTH domain
LTSQVERRNDGNWVYVFPLEGATVKPRDPYHDDDFRKEISRKLKEVRETTPFSVAKVADELGIKRQAFYQYLNGATTPRPEILIKMIRKWDLRLDLHGFMITKEQFPTLTIPEMEKPIQLKFRNKPMEVKSGKMIVSISSRDAKTIAVEIKLAS